MRTLLGAIMVDLSILLDHLKCMWVNKRWISEKEYYEIKRGN